MTEGPYSKLDGRVDPNEPPYRSRGEAQLGRMLNRYSIPFHYERATLLLEAGRPRIWYPDFVLPAHANLIVEYAGMMERPDYAAGIRHKQEIYAANRFPALFVYPNELAGPQWPDQLVERINRAIDKWNGEDVYALYRCLRR